MKTFLLMTAISIPFLTFGNTAVIDERNLKELDTPRELQHERETIRDKAAKNPRNKTFPKSFQKVDDSRQMEESMEDDPFIDNYGNGSTTNRKVNP